MSANILSEIVDASIVARCLEVGVGTAILIIRHGVCFSEVTAKFILAIHSNIQKSYRLIK